MTTESNKTELFKYTRMYLGPDNWEYMRKTTQAELKLFQSYNLDLETSYFVRGNEDLLKKFKAFYLTRCLKKRPLYTQCSLYEFVENSTGADKDEFGLNISKELLFLYMHEHPVKIGRSEEFRSSFVISKAADRNRQGLVTIILSEIEVKDFEKCGEFEVIDLSKAGIQSAIKNISQKPDSNSNGYRNM
jgi:hypothetical protein